MSIHRRFVPLVVIAGVAFAACTSAATPAPTTAPATQAPSAAASASAVADGTLPKPELSSVKMSSPINQFSQFGAVLAEQLGIYEKYGISVTLSKFNAEGDAVSALLSGATDVLADTGAASSFTSAAAGTPVIAIAVEKIGVFDDFICAPSIKTAADVKGKVVAISTFGSAGHASALLGLKAIGLTPNDVTIQQVGGDSVRQAALKAGSVACAPSGVENWPVLQALGFNKLADLSTHPELEYPAVGMSAPAAWLQKYPNTALDLVAAELEATSIMLHDRTTTVQQWSLFSQTDTTKAGQIYDLAVAQLNKDLTWHTSGFAFAQSVTASVNAAVSKVDVASVADASFLKKLNDLGFYKKVNMTYPTAPWP